MTPAWSEAAILDLTGITAVVAGASGSIGVQVARGLASKRAHVVLSAAKVTAVLIKRCRIVLT